MVGCLAFFSSVGVYYDRGGIAWGSVEETDVEVVFVPVLCIDSRVIHGLMAGKRSSIRHVLA